MALPAVVILLSGKRKSGKDYVASILEKRLSSEVCCIMRLSEPLKSQYAKEHGLEFDRLLDASSYKELYRSDMIKWGEERRNQDPGFFCRLATQRGKDHPIWIISDTRRPTDLQYFSKTYAQKTITVRIEADLSVRIGRGFTFTEGVDDAESECGLDSEVNWDFHIFNNNDQGLEEQIMALINQVQSRLSKHDSKIHLS